MIPHTACLPRPNFYALYLHTIISDSESEKEDDEIDTSMDIFSSLGQGPSAPQVTGVRARKKPRLEPAPAGVTTSTAPPPPGPGSALKQLEVQAGNNNLPPDVTLVLTNLISESQKEMREMREKINQLEKAPKTQKEPADTEYSDPDPDDKSLWVTIGPEHVGLQDDGCQKLNLMALRAKLRPPNVDPSSWPWGKKSFPCVEAVPKRAASLYLDHISGSKRPHPSTVFKSHDRAKAIKVQELWSKNGARGQEPDYIFSFTGQTAANQKSFKSQRDWKAPEVSCYLMHYTNDFMVVNL